MSDLRDILDFNYKYKGWDGFEIDPFDREDSFKLNKGVKFPDIKGVYMFESFDNGIYYIGQAKTSLHTRLKDKVKNDIRENRVTNYRDKNGKLFHDYPYLPIYDTEKSKIKYLKTNSLSKPSIAERILIAAYHIANGYIPKANRTGLPSYARLKEVEAVEALNEIADNFDLRK
jgi:hypothetical protein